MSVYKLVVGHDYNMYAGTSNLYGSILYQADNLDDVYEAYLEFLPKMEYKLDVFCGLSRIDIKNYPWFGERTIPYAGKRLKTSKNV